MSSTARRPSPKVYRRRRLVILAALVIIAVVVWLLIARPWSGAAEGNGDPGTSNGQPAATDLPGVDPKDADAAADPSASPAGTPKPDPSADPTTDAEPTVKDCVASGILVEAVTDKVTYAAGELPQLSIQLTNRGKDCTLNVGTTQQKFTVMSGGDTWWRSTDCQSEPSDMVVLLEAGKTVKSAAPVVWDRTRSSPSSCADTDRPSAPGAGASYHVSVEIGGIPSQSTQQILLYG